MTDMINTTADTEEKIASDNINENSSDNEKTGEKLFTQKQVEALLSERIKRERKVNEALMPLKQVLKGLLERDEFKGKSYEEMAGELVKKLSEPNQVVCKAQEKAALEKNVLEAEEATESTAANSRNVSSAAEEQDGEEVKTRENSHGTQTEKEENEFLSQKDADGYSKGTLEIDELCAFKEKYPHADMNKLFEKGMFKSFAKGKNAPLSKICEDFCEFLSDFEKSTKQFAVPAELGEEYESRGGSNMLSTAFSSHSGTPHSFSDGLTKQQMEIADSAGLSYREYAQLLSSIPRGRHGNINSI